MGLGVGARSLEQVMMGCQVVCACFSMDVFLLGSVHEPGCTSLPKDQALHPPCSSSAQGGGWTRLVSALVASLTLSLPAGDGHNKSAA